MFGSVDLPGGVRLRMTAPGDRDAERTIHDANRPELQLIDGEQDFVRSIYDMQFNARNTGYGDSFPDALYYMIEKAGETVGRLVLDFGSNEVRVVDISILPAYHGQGIGKIVITALKDVAAKIAAPMALCVRRDNGPAMQLYAQLGFVIDASADQNSMYFMMRWEPGRADMGTRSIIMGN